MEKDKRIKLLQVVTLDTGDDYTLEARKYWKTEDGADLTLWAAYRAMKGSNRYSDNANQDNADAEFTINRRKGITADWYIEYLGTGNFYKIIYVDDFDGNSVNLKLTAKLNNAIGLLPRTEEVAI